MEADALTIQLDATLSGLTVLTSIIPTIFTLDALPAATLPISASDRHQVCWVACPVA